MQAGPERTQLLATLSKLIGEPLSEMDLHMGAARANNPAVDGNPHIQAVHAMIGVMGTSAKLMETMLLHGVQGAPAPSLPPGMRVADFGSVGADEGVYSGPVNEATLTAANRRWIANNVQRFSNKWGQVFNAKVKFPSQAGDAMDGEQDPLTPDGYDLQRLSEG